MAQPVDRRIKALRRFATSITGFMLVGHLVLGFEQSWAQVAVVLATAYGAELTLETLEARMQARKPRYRGTRADMINFMLPAHIAAMSISFLIFPNGRLWPFVFAGVVAVAAKYLVTAPVNGRQRHVFNPSNLAIAATLTLFPWVGPAPTYHFTSFAVGVWDWVVPLVLLASGLLLNTQLTGKWPLIAAWLTGFAAQAVLRGVLTGDVLAAALAPMTGTAFLLYTNYMITDPGTTPVRPRNQVVFGATTAAVYGLLVSFDIVFGLFYALVLTCGLRGLMLWAIALRADRHALAAEVAPAPVAPALAGARR